MDLENKNALAQKLAIGAGAAYATVYLYQAWDARRKLRHIPSVGPSGIFSSYLGALRYVKDARRIIQEGYEQYEGNAFKVPLMTRWIVVISGRDRVDELRKATDDVVSLRQAFNESIQIKYTLGQEVAVDPYHVATVRTPLTRNIAIRFPDIQDEISVSFAEHIPVTDEWSTLRVLPAIMEITCRTSNRLFVGLPLCRNEDYRRLNIEFTSQLIRTGNKIGLFPWFLRPIAGRLLTNVSKSIDRGLKHLGPIIQERLEKDATYGLDWEGRPNDLISWLLEIAEGPHREPRSLALRVLAVNFAAIHTTSMTFTQVIFDLAQRPEYIAELREEIETIAKTEGFTKTSMLKLVKCDSFIKESQRLGGIAALSMQRKMLQDFKFSDGLVIPKGAYVAVASSSMHRDETHYSDPSAFDGYRFLKMAGSDDEFNKHSMVTLGTDYIVFGHGRHACPGRFFAVNEIKAFLCHLLMNYDIMLNPEAPPFKNLWFNSSAVPDPTATLLFRKRPI